MDWDEAKQLQEKMNEGKEDCGEPKWSFDCGFKLDFDGSLINVSSRFYPPKTHYGSTWDGNVEISILGQPLEKKSFDCPSLEQLNQEVEQYVEGFLKNIKSILQNHYKH